MFKRLRMQNFRKHTDSTFNLESGVVALKGANESGKTTMCEAMVYVMFGATALRESLAETVTWGQKESSLRVELDFAADGVVYTAKRSKSGAEVLDANGVILATGQSEVRKFFEALLRCSADTARNLMLADQKTLVGILTKGPGAAIELIETLANFSLIDTIIGLVQTKLPNGATTAVESRISTLEEQMQVPVEDTTVDLSPIVDQARQNVQADRELQRQARELYDAVQPRSRQAQAQVDNEKALAAQVAALERAVATSEASLASIQPVPGPTSAEVAELRKAVEDVTRLRRAAQTKLALEQRIEPENEWEGDLTSLQTEVNSCETYLQSLQKQLSQSQQAQATATALLITQTACGLCGKDLQDVPEVSEKNAVQQEAIREEAELQAQILPGIEQTKADLSAMRSILAVHMQHQSLLQQASEFIELDTGYVPHRWTWTGPDVSQPADPAADTARLKAAEAKVARYQQDVGRQQQAKSALQQAQSNLQATQIQLQAAQALLPAAQAVLNEAAEITQSLYTIENDLKASEQALQTAERDLQQARAVLEERLRAVNLVKTQLLEARKELDSTRFNNDLIKDLRAARPSIANELWGVMSASISQYFSDIRGVPSVFSREADGFKIDGRGLGGLSGSTLDALGLAIRISATKTFLPGNRFLVLDEPAAAADDNRESNMLGVIASSDFDQTIIVSHSAILDSYANQVIQL
jgi:DNA repair exonuclease SbcCD ATPase subunit